MQDCELTSLAKLSRDQAAIITKVTVAGKSAKRLADLGLTPGTTIRVVRKTLVGTVEIKVKGANLVLGRDLAAKILIRLE